MADLLNVRYLIFRQRPPAGLPVILEGDGYDLHWDPEFKLDVAYEWSWAEQAKRFEWSADDFVYIPPYVTHQHFAGPRPR